MGHKQRRNTAPVAKALFVPPSVEALLGPDAEQLITALHEAPPVSVRHNPAKPGGPEGDAVPWAAQGRYLAERPRFIQDPLFHAGAYYVQEAASMLVEQAVLASGSHRSPIRALDLCAAPGGKSTHLAALLHPDSLLVANEPVHDRRHVLAENCWKQGRPGTAIGRFLPAALPNEAFDLILADAPCSGEGMFRKDPFARSQWSKALVDQCAALQADILHHAWRALNPGGTLIYSTCTWESAENEDQIARLLQAGAEALPLHLQEAWGFVPSGGGYRAYPHRVRGEGFFLACLRKPSARRVSGTAPPAHALPEPFRQWIAEPARYAVLQHNDTPHLVQAEQLHFLQHLAHTGLLGHPGTPLAQRKADAWIPHPALALSQALAPDAFPRIKLDIDQARAYLRGETLRANDVHGPALATYDELGIGWLHGAGNRWNNRWPAPWRIRER